MIPDIRSYISQGDQVGYSSDGGTINYIAIFKIKPHLLSILIPIPLKKPTIEQLGGSHGCSIHSNLEMEAEFLTKKLLILEFKYLQNKKWQKRAVKSTRIKSSCRTY